MKFFILLFYTSFFGLSVQSQIAKVLYVSGPVRIKSTGELLKKGTRISENQELVFSRLADTVLLAIKGKGLGVCNPQHDPRFASAGTGEIRTIIREFLWYRSVEDYIKGRDGDINTYYDLANYFHQWKDNHLLVIDKLFVPLTKIFFKQLPLGFFYMQYTYGTEKINKRLEIDSTLLNSYSIVIDTSLLMLDGKKVFSHFREGVQLFYYSKEVKESRLVTSFKIETCTSSFVKDEICALKEEGDWQYIVIPYLEHRWGQGNVDQLLKRIATLQCP